MQADLVLGLREAMWITLAVTVLYGLIYFVQSVFSFELDDLLLFGGVLVSTAASVACVLVPSLNLALNLIQNPDLHNYWNVFALIRAEFASGVFPLRVTAVLVGLQAITSLLKIATTSAFHLKPEDWKQLFDFAETTSVPELPPIPAYRNRFAQYVLNATQCGFYEAAMVVLWWLNIESRRIPAAAVLAWLLFYIVDDWRIMNHYSTAFKGRLLRRHARQVWMTNVAILLLAAYCAYHLGVLVLVAFLGASYAILRLLLLLINGFEGAMSIVNALNWPYIYKRYDQTTGKVLERDAG